MIVTSLVLIGGSVLLLVLGLWQGSSAILSGSIAASLLAATVLVVNARRATVPRSQPVHRAGARAPAGRAPVVDSPAIPGQGPPGPSGPGASGRAPAGQGVALALDPGPSEPELDLDPPDEPARQQVSPDDAARVGRMRTEVLVVDGRPRYHLPGCVHLLGRESEPLPVSEAVELGFSPCSLCEPDSALLAGARRG